jgi:hypothetical protein
MAGGSVRREVIGFKDELTGKYSDRVSWGWRLGILKDWEYLDYRAIFEAVLLDPRYVFNLDWGESPGAP